MARREPVKWTPDISQEQINLIKKIDDCLPDYETSTVPAAIASAVDQMTGAEIRQFITDAGEEMARLYSVLEKIKTAVETVKKQVNTHD